MIHIDTRFVVFRVVGAGRPRGHQLGEADLRIDHDGAHLGQVLQCRDRGPRRRRCGRPLCRSRDKGGSPGRASARRGCGCSRAAGTPGCVICGDVDAGGQQVDGDRDRWVCARSGSGGSASGRSVSAGDLLHRVVAIVAIRRGERLLELIDDDVGVPVGGAEDQGLLVSAGSMCLASSSETTRLNFSGDDLLLNSSTSKRNSSGT